MLCVKLGKGKYELYPEGIQQQLRIMYAQTVTDATSQEMEYDMTGGWVYKLRLFNQEERDSWETFLAKWHEPHFVGVQWKADRTNVVSPREFDPSVQYRPIRRDTNTQTQTGNVENGPRQ